VTERKTRRLPRLSFLLALGAFLLSGPAIAAEDGGTSTATESSGQDLTSKQKTDYVSETVVQIEEAMMSVLGMMEQAQDNKDVIWLNCLTEKYGLLKGLQKVAQDAEFGLAEAITRENVDLEEFNFRKAFIAREQSATVTAEADACVGQVGTSFPGQTRVVTRYDGPGEADQDFGAAAGGNTRPPDASPLD